MRKFVGMRYYRVWRAAVAALAGMGVVTALVFVAPGPNLAVFVFAGFTAGALSVSLGLSWEQPSAEVFRAAPRWAALGGGVAVAIIGYGAAVGVEVLLLLLVIAGTSPPVVAWFGWLEVAPNAPLKEQSPPKLHAELKPLDAPALDYAVLLHDLTAAELCLAWRRSFGELRRTEHWAATTDVRQAYLDELERRYPDEFVAWLASGPRAASDPRRFFDHGADHAGG
ncbi:hypothetical protein E1263_21155 [Kribbella antibiotica]|uniref:Uncharacterized protein n=1 Tax=Kribbella antibiotica TaxID=190195 RepID=A0A4R4ZHD3_9ACTN|nr:hypothetical protein [Kribbella antibiotica]TDD57973.1 hypothetical protein E1263_21155 [Kribbella antibiotica]